MQALPHLYRIKAQAKSESYLDVNGENLPPMEVAAPIGFNGPGNIWSPEDLLMSSVASCTILSFKAIARASKLDWVSIECVSEGVLDRVDRKTQFTKITTKAKLTIFNEDDAAKAEKLLHKAEETCLVSNSLTAESLIECEIVIESAGT